MPTRFRALLKPFAWVLLLPFVPMHVEAQGTEVESLEEAPAIQQRIREERQQGNAEAAWTLEQALLRLVVRFPDDVRSARILRDVGDYRIDMLARYDAGEYPPEIVLGCYYFHTDQYAEASRRGSQPLMSGSGGRTETNTCAAGSNSRARLALATEALNLYAEAARTLRRSGQAAEGEVEEFLMKALSTSYRVLDYRTGLSSLQALLSYQEENSASLPARARTLALMGDWNILFTPHFGRKYADVAAERYQEAIALLAGNDVADEAVDSIFNPETPILLPTFTRNRLLSQPADDATGYVDVSFEIEQDGKTARIEILDASDGVSRSLQRDVTNTIKHGRFRPLAADGQLLESGPVTVRYYLND